MRCNAFERLFRIDLKGLERIVAVVVLHHNRVNFTVVAVHSAQRVGSGAVVNRVALGEIFNLVAYLDFQPALYDNVDFLTVVG